MGDKHKDCVFDCVIIVTSLLSFVNGCVMFANVTVSLRHEMQKFPSVYLRLKFMFGYSVS